MVPSRAGSARSNEGEREGGGEPARGSVSDGPGGLARHQRAVGGGATTIATSSSELRLTTTWVGWPSLHSEAAWFGRVRAIGVAKHVSFEKKELSLKIVLK